MHIDRPSLTYAKARACLTGLSLVMAEPPRGRPRTKVVLGKRVANNALYWPDADVGIRRTALSLPRRRQCELLGTDLLATRDAPGGGRGCAMLANA